MGLIIGFTSIILVKYVTNTQYLNRVLMLLSRNINHRFSTKKPFQKTRQYHEYQKQYSLFVLGLYGPVNNEVMSSWSVNSGPVPGQA